MFDNHGFAQFDFVSECAISLACNSDCNRIFLQVLSLTALQTFAAETVFANCMSAICIRSDKLKIISAGGSLLGS